MKTIANIIFSFLCVTLIAQSPHIHVDQFGYYQDASKVVVLSNPITGNNSNLSYTPASQLELRSYPSDSLIGAYAPTIWNSGATQTDWSGDQGWWLDFTSMTTPGTYYIADPNSLDTSAIFTVGPTVYDEAMKAASRMFYYNRCNMSKSAPYAEANWVDTSSNFDNALQDVNCRYIYDQANATLEKDLSGGWFDAGDYNKYVTFTMSTLHNLLWAYRDNPQVFGDNNNIPESGNGIADILDEIKWELDWLLKMTNPDGSVHIKMGSKNYSENTSFPPSANTDPRYYGPTCTSASLTAASVLAHAAKIYGDIPGMTSYAAQLRSNAEVAWNYVLLHYSNGTLEYDCDDGSIVAGDADFDEVDYQEGMISAAIYLFDLTGENTYNSFISSNYDDSVVFGNIANDPSDITTYYDDWWDINHVESKDAFLHYKNIAGHDPQIASNFFDSFQAIVNNDWGDFYGTSAVDLYRAHMPDYFLGWGSNFGQGSMGVINFMVQKYGADNGSPDDYIIKGSNHLHYLHGNNPLGKLYLSNMYGKGGDRCADEIYHTWFADNSDYDNALTSLFGPAPGYLAGGPNHTYDGGLTPPQGEPYLKAYADINNAANESWKITEPAIYYQAAYIRLLSNIMALDDNMTNGTGPHLSVSDIDIEIFPNPIDQFFVIEGTLSLYDIDILDAAGQIIQSIHSIGLQETIDTSSLGSGLYFLRVTHKNNGNLYVKKIIKP